MLIPAVGAELPSTAAVGQKSAIWDSGSANFTAVLATTDPNLRNYS